MSNESITVAVATTHPISSEDNAISSSCKNCSIEGPGPRGSSGQQMFEPEHMGLLHSTLKLPQPWDKGLGSIQIPFPPDPPSLKQFCPPTCLSPFRMLLSPRTLWSLRELGTLFLYIPFTCEYMHKQRIDLGSN